jgi:hypothetical protein
VSSVTESKQFSNIAATTAQFTLKGGKYGVAVVATFGGGSVILQGLSLDGTTFVTVVASFTAAGYATCDLPPGQYRFTIATATAVYASVTSVPS